MRPKTKHVPEKCHVVKPPVLGTSMITLARSTRIIRIVRLLRLVRMQEIMTNASGRSWCGGNQLVKGRRGDRGVSFC